MTAEHDSLANLVWQVAELSRGRYMKRVLLAPLEAAAGAFADPQHVADDDVEWVEMDSERGSIALEDVDVLVTDPVARS